MMRFETKTIPELIKAINAHRSCECDGCPYDGPKRGRCLDKLLEDIQQTLNRITDDGK